MDKDLMKNESFTSDVRIYNYILIRKKFGSKNLIKCQNIN